MAVTSKLTPENLLESNRNSILLFVFLQSHSNYGALSFVIHHPNVRTFCPHFSLEDHGTWQVQCTPSIDSKTAIEGLVFRSIASYMGFPFETTQDSSFPILLRNPQAPPHRAPDQRHPPATPQAIQRAAALPGIWPSPLLSFWAPAWLAPCASLQLDLGSAWELVGIQNPESIFGSRKMYDHRCPNCNHRCPDASLLFPMRGAQCWYTC